MKSETPARPRILLVDDTEANLVALEAQLGDMGCELISTQSGNGALRELLKGDFAVMLLDVQMPDMDGFEVATHARENPVSRDVPIIFVTAMIETEDKVLRGYGSGAVDFLFKPINSYILRSKVRVFLDLYLARCRLADEIDSHKRTLAEVEAFNYSVSHDLRAPLRPIDGFSQAILEDCGDQLDERGKDYLRRIRSAAQRMSQLIDDLLRLSRLGRAHVSVHPVDLSALCQAIIAELNEEEVDRKVTWKVAPALVADGDPSLLRIALENLLRNAFKFTRKKAEATIEFGKRIEQGRSVFFVKDDGNGFDPAFAGRLFQPFQRLHSSSDYEGTGIGLAIVRRVIDHHRGQIWAEAAPDQGATFFFSLNRHAGVG
jgi:two-component system sensor histidine kinase/response regulator